MYRPQYVEPQRKTAGKVDLARRTRKETCRTGMKLTAIDIIVPRGIENHVAISSLSRAHRRHTQGSEWLIVLT